MSISNEDDDVVELHIKILVVGESNVGKTSILQRYINDYFSSKYKATIGVDFLLKTIEWKAGTMLSLQFWDIAGQERFGHLTPMYYRSAAGAFVVFDSSEPKRRSLDFVPRWKEDLDSNLSTPELRLPVVLVANKVDDPESNVDEAEIQRLCSEQGFVGWAKTSAKTGEGIENAVKMLVTAILKNNLPELVKGNVSLESADSGSNGGAANSGVGRGGDSGCHC